LLIVNSLTPGTTMSPELSLYSKDNITHAFDFLSGVILIPSPAYLPLSGSTLIRHYSP